MAADDMKSSVENGLIAIMRHSTRLDDEAVDFDSIPESVWADRDERPYDTPICDFNLPARLHKKWKYSK